MISINNIKVYNNKLIKIESDSSKKYKCSTLNSVKNKNKSCKLTLKDKMHKSFLIKKINKYKV